MRISRVQFKNYRCFLDDEVLIPKESEGKTLNLFVAPNGGGKTEFLFSIWWALYPSSFKFSDLSGKEATNYSLNTDLYFQLQQGTRGAKQECFVEVEIEEGNSTYIIHRKEIFEKKNAKKPVSKMSCTFYSIDSNGITTPPIYDIKEIDKKIERIIPKKVLNGILFDGERMKKISSINEESVKSIEGVITDITNKEVLTTFESELNSLKNYYQKIIRMNAKKMKAVDLENVATGLESINQNKKENKLKLVELEINIPELQSQIKEISDELQELEISREIEEELKKAENDLKHYESNYFKSLQTFKSQLSKEGAYLLVNKLKRDLHEVVKHSDVPLGLNADIISSILKKDSCICGTTFSKEMRTNLINLSDKLPPNDINATIKSNIKLIEFNSNKSLENIKRLYKQMDQHYEAMRETKEVISQLKSRLTQSVSEQVVKLEISRGKLEDKLENIILHKTEIDENIKELEKQEQKLTTLQEKLTEKQLETKRLQHRKEFIEKSLKAIDLINEKYRTIALSQINKLFEKAYQNISEDYQSGRRAYLTHQLNDKYLMVTYNEKDLKNYLKDVLGYEINDILHKDIEKDIFEQAINAIKVSNSTGQQTVLSLAFVKAILDYSRKKGDEKDKDLKKVKSYPLVIDAPFSDLSGENLKNAAEKLHEFSKQVLLLVNNNSFDNIRNNISEHLNSTHYFQKSNEGNYSKIEIGVFHNV